MSGNLSFNVHKVIKVQENVCMGKKREDNILMGKKITG